MIVPGECSAAVSIPPIAESETQSVFCMPLLVITVISDFPSGHSANEIEETISVQIGMMIYLKTLIRFMSYLLILGVIFCV
jgi:hypothetical protein